MGKWDGIFRTIAKKAPSNLDDIVKHLPVEVKSKLSELNSESLFPIDFKKEALNHALGKDGLLSSELNDIIPFLSRELNIPEQKLKTLSIDELDTLLRIDSPDKSPLKLKDIITKNSASSKKHPETFIKKVLDTNKETDEYLKALDSAYGPIKDRQGDSIKNAYHGTRYSSNIDELRPTKGGYYGPGLYSADNIDTALKYGDHIYPLKIPTNLEKNVDSSLFREIQSASDVESAKKIAEANDISGINVPYKGYNTTIDPKKIRHVQAAFDPRFKNSSKILATGTAALLGSGIINPEEAEAGFGSNTWNRVKDILKYVKDKSPEQVDKALSQLYKESNENTLESTGYLDLNDLATKARINRHEIMGGLRAAQDPVFRDLMNSPYSSSTEKELLDIFKKEIQSDPETKHIILDPISNKKAFQEYKNKIAKSSKLSRQEKVRIINDMDELERMYKTDKGGSSIMYTPGGKKYEPMLLKLDPKDIKSVNETVNLIAALEGTKQHELFHAKEFPFKYSLEETAHRNLNKATNKNNRVLDSFGLKKAEEGIDNYSAPKVMDIYDQAQDYAHFDTLKDTPNNIQTLEQKLIQEELEKYRQGKKIAGIAGAAALGSGLVSPEEAKADAASSRVFKNIINLIQKNVGKSRLDVEDAVFNEIMKESKTRLTDVPVEKLKQGNLIANTIGADVHSSLYGALFALDNPEYFNIIKSSIDQKNITPGVREQIEGYFKNKIKSGLVNPTHEELVDVYLKNVPENIREEVSKEFLTRLRLIGARLDRAAPRSGVWDSPFLVSGHELLPSQIRISKESTDPFYLAGIAEHELAHDVDYKNAGMKKYSELQKITDHKNVDSLTKETSPVLSAYGADNYADLVAKQKPEFLPHAARTMSDDTHFIEKALAPVSYTTREHDEMRKLAYGLTNTEKYDTLMKMLRGENVKKNVAAIAPLTGVSGFEPIEVKPEPKYIENLDELYETKQQKRDNPMNLVPAAKDIGMVIRGIKDATYGPVIEDIKDKLKIGDDRSDFKNRTKDSAVELIADPMNLVNIPLSVGLGVTESLVDEDEYQEQKKRWKNILGSITTGRPHNSVMDDIKE